MSHDFAQTEAMKQEIEKILKRNQKFGPLHRLALSENEELMLTWTNSELRPKVRANQPAYVSFMEELTDCLLEFGYCLSADDDATETEKNDYFFIVPDDGSEGDEDMDPW